MMAIICADGSHPNRNKSHSQQWNIHQERTMALQEEIATHTCRKETETKSDPDMMQATEEHQEIPTEHAAVMPVGEPRKQHRVQNLALESRRRRKDRTRGNHRSMRKSPATCRKVPRHAKVAWRNRQQQREELFTMVLDIQLATDSSSTAQFTPAHDKESRVQKTEVKIHLPGKVVQNTEIEERVSSLFVKL
jgi:hypothetical protein